MTLSIVSITSTPDVAETDHCMLFVIGILGLAAVVAVVVGIMIRARQH